MTRAEVKTKLDLVRKEIKSINNTIEEDIVVFATANKYIEGIGFIADLDSIEDVLKAHSFIRKKDSVDFDASIKELGITEDELPEKSTTMYLGFPLKYWYADIKNRLARLRLEIRLSKLEQAEDVLNKYLSDDDRFGMDMDSLKGIID